MPYDIPDSWEWVRLRNISSLSFFPNISGDKIPNYSWVLDMEDIEKETGRLVRKNYKTEKSSYKSNKVYFSKDTVLYAKLRPNLKKVIISDEDGFATTELIPIKILGGISPEYMRYCMISPSYYFNIIKSVYGVKMPRVNATFLNSTLIPLPPFAEQKRIVAQIERTLKKVEDYAESYNKLQELDKTFPDKLKKSILQYAMQGKLVPQDPNDEPVEILLEKIQAEKQKLYEEGKLKKKDLGELVISQGDDNSPYKEVPYSIPKSWKWVRLGTLITLTSGRDLKSSEYIDGEIIGLPYLTGASNFQNGQVETNRYTDKPSVISLKGELLITVKGTIGEMAFNPFEQVHIARQIMAIQSIYLNLHFLRYLLTYSLPNIKQQAQSMIPGISRENLLHIFTPFLPLAEQQRIVSKISQVFSVIESLV
ncbi:restriction endonuclease subunit S [Streptococcus ruminantium]|uniref:restriction endonuclease subunit S n=1 Tax=Streptococcus ruminantium TaxID=1917441 RepID=UPI0012DEC28A